nr:hypothetical protein [Tanacetum cinerariifolium]
SLDPLYGDYIELNDLNEPLELKRNQVDDLEPTIEECTVVDELMMDIVKTRYDNGIVDGLDEYPSYYDFDRKIHIDCAYNLQFLCMIGYKHINANFFPLLSISVMSKNIYNSIVKDKILNMDSYYDEGMGDVIVGRPFYTEACVKARRFDGMITIYKGNDYPETKKEEDGEISRERKVERNKRNGAIPSMKAVDANKAIQDMVDHSQKRHNGTSTREIKKVNEKVYATQVGCELCKGPHYTKDCLLKE